MVESDITRNQNNVSFKKALLFGVDSFTGRYLKTSFREKWSIGSWNNFVKKSFDRL